MVLVGHVACQDYVTKKLTKIIGRSPSWQVTSLPSFVATDTQVVGM